MFGPGLRTPESFTAEVQSPLMTDEDPRLFLRECAAMFFSPLCDAVHASVNATNDLFDRVHTIPAPELAAFRAGRSRWIDEFERALRAGYEARIDGRGRHERRPDAEGPQSEMQLLDTAEQDSQISLVDVVRNLRRVTHLEVSALTPRISLLLGEPMRKELDNPFGPPYVLDAMGGPARAVFASPRTARALMTRVVAEVTPALYRIYVAQNRFLADRGVLPDIKAWLRNRSQYRPGTDRELVATFRRLQSVARTRGGGARPVRMSELALAPDETKAASPGHAPPAGAGRTPASAARPQDKSDPPAPPVSDADIQAAIVALLPRPTNMSGLPSAPLGPADDAGLPAVDARIASHIAQDPVLTGVAQFAQTDLRFAIVSTLATRGGTSAGLSAIPQNLIPHLRAVLATRKPPPEILVAADLVNHLFDFIFHDPAVPAALHPVFERLQLPVLRIALFDPEFFAEIDHPARILLNDLAEAAIGAPDDAEYLARLLQVAGEVARKTCAATHLDFATLEHVAIALRRFIAEERRRTMQAIAADVETAREAERRDLARSEAMLAIRGRLAGRDPPPRIRKFAETVWVDYLASIKRRDDSTGPSVVSALQTMDDLVWSVCAKERPADKKRLQERIPSLVSELRHGCAKANLSPELVEEFMNELYRFHVAEIKAARETPATTGRVAAEPGSTAYEAEPSKVGDFVVELILGTWVRFNSRGKAHLMRLCWASIMREHYVFAGRGEGRGRVLTPEDLVRELDAGNATVVVEPIPLVERAIDAAFDAIGSGASPKFRYSDAGAHPV
jgi:hypothetical protein